MKRYEFRPDKMSKGELDRLGAEAEAVTYHNTRPLTAESRRALARAAKKGGRPRVGAGAKRINITVEKKLLSKADAYARRHGLSRAAVVAEGLRLCLKTQWPHDGTESARMRGTAARAGSVGRPFERA